jgi:hypothetical protein
MRRVKKLALAVSIVVIIAILLLVPRIPYSPLGQEPAHSGQASILSHKVTFNETGTGCGAYGREPKFAINYVPSWAATLGNTTMVQPSNATLPLPGLEGPNSPTYATISKITFTVPDGSYPYHVSLGQDGDYIGTVVVNGYDVVIQVIGPLCT